MCYFKVPENAKSPSRPAEGKTPVVRIGFVMDFIGAKFVIKKRHTFGKLALRWSLFLASEWAELICHKKSRLVRLIEGFGVCGLGPMQYEKAKLACQNEGFGVCVWVKSDTKKRNQCSKTKVLESVCWVECVTKNQDQHGELKV